MKILVLHGPNLNLLGRREPGIYGTRTLADLDKELAAVAGERGIDIDFFQSNHEGAIIDRIHAAAGDGPDPALRANGFVINPGAYSHTSLAIADAIAGVDVPAVEVHLSNIHARGPERARSVVAAACRGQISGFGFVSYRLGIDAVLAVLET